MPASYHPDQSHIGVQMSEFYDSRDRFLCIGFARPLALRPESAAV